MTIRAYLQVNLVIVDDRRRRVACDDSNVPRADDCARIEIPITHANAQVADITTRVAVRFRELRELHPELRPSLPDPAEVCRAERAKRAARPDPADAAIAAARVVIDEQATERKALRPIRVGARRG